MKGRYSTYSDADLVAIMKAKSSESHAAFMELYLRYSAIVNAYCMRVFSNKEIAEDIFQETFIRFYQKAQTDYENMNVPGFLIRIARNLCLNYKRDTRVTVPIEDMDYIVNESPNYEKKELLDLIQRSLELLDFEYREAFVLREYDGLSYEEIAKICDITVSNAKSRVFRAKQKIKSILQPYMQNM